MLGHSKLLRAACCLKEHTCAAVQGACTAQRKATVASVHPPRAVCNDATKELVNNVCLARCPLGTTRNATTNLCGGRLGCICGGGRPFALHTGSFYLLHAQAGRGAGFHPWITSTNKQGWCSHAHTRTHPTAQETSFQMPPLTTAACAVGRYLSNGPCAACPFGTTTAGVGSASAADCKEGAVFFRGCK